MEVGIGHHGEPGIEVTALEDAAGIAKRMCGIVIDDLPFKTGDEVAVLISGLGATPVMELYVLYDEVERILTKEGLSIVKPYVGNYFTSLEMMGASLTMMKLDSELKELIELNAYSMGLKQK
jgi:dihydroxyacetone kinase-like protein